MLGHRRWKDGGMPEEPKKMGGMCSNVYACVEQYERVPVCLRASERGGGGEEEQWMQ